MATKAIEAYAQFVTLKVKENDYDATLLSPTDIIDQIWHTHILDTRAYLECNQGLLKNKFIHHDPFGAIDQVARQGRVITAMTAYKQHFGEHAPQNHIFWTSDIYIKKDLDPVTIEYYDESRSCLLLEDKEVVEILPMFGLRSKEGMIIYEVRKNLQLALTTRWSKLHNWTCEPIRLLDADDAARRARPLAQRRKSRIFVTNVRDDLTDEFHVDLGPHGDFGFELKQMIQDKRGIPARFMILSFCGKVFKDYDRLNDGRRKPRVIQGVTIQLVVTLTGA